MKELKNRKRNTLTARIKSPTACLAVLVDSMRYCSRIALFSSLGELRAMKYCTNSISLLLLCTAEAEVSKISSSRPLSLESCIRVLQSSVMYLVRLIRDL